MRFSWLLLSSCRTTSGMSNYLSKTADLEEVFKQLGLELVFKAKSDKELAALVKHSIEELEEFKQLPSFRRYGILQFIEGAHKGTAKLVGMQLKESDKKKSVDVPRNVKKLQEGVTWRQHINGGGWVSETAYVEATAFVGKTAVVYENARVTERARIYGFALVRGDAECFGAAHVHGNAIVEGRAKVCDSARVLGKVRVGGNVTVGGTSLVRGDVVLKGEQEFLDERVAPDRILGVRV